MSTKDMFVAVTSRTENSVRSKMINEASVSDLYKMLMTSIGNSQYDLESELSFIKTFIMRGVLISNFIAASGYRNLLVLPSFKNSLYPTLFDNETQQPRNHIISSLWPSISEYFEQSPKIHYAFPIDHSSFCRDLSRDFGVSNVVCNKPYVVGDDTFSVENGDIQFDAVFLAGQPVEEGTTFAAADIKSDLASICTEDFDLIEMCNPIGYDIVSMWRHVADNTLLSHQMPPRPTVFTGQEKDTREISEYINSTMKYDTDPDVPQVSNLVPRISKILHREIKVY